MVMICVDFQPGQHGNYLEFVCNKFLAGIETVHPTPFNVHGASHSKTYKTEPVFVASHYFELYGKRTVPDSGDIISIRITEDDILPLNAISLLRAGDHGFENNQLEVNTFNKLSNRDYIKPLQQIVDSFFKTQVEDSYRAVKDPSWPEVTTLKEFNQLPDWIRTECKDVHNLNLLEFSEESPDCPRWVLREFFKIGFLNPAASGFMAAQTSKMYYNSSNRVLNFPFSSFYSLAEFTDQMYKIAAWANMEFTVSPEFVSLHKQFLSKQPYIHVKTQADSIVAQIISGVDFSVPAVNLLQESYISAMLEKHYGIESPSGPNSWFETARDFREYFDERRY